MRNSEGSLVTDSKKKAEILLKQFKSVFTPDSNPSPNQTDHIQQCPDIDQIVVSQDGVQKLLQDIKTEKATGPDSIPNLVLKECAKELSPAITCIFQASLDTGELPTTGPMLMYPRYTRKETSTQPKTTDPFPLPQ